MTELWLEGAKWEHCHPQALSSSLMSVCLPVYLIDSHLLTKYMKITNGFCVSKSAG